MYTSRVFRKLHLEVAHRQDGLQVLHAVLYPRYAYDVPILAMDLVVAKGWVRGRGGEGGRQAGGGGPRAHGVRRTEAW